MGTSVILDTSNFDHNLSPSEVNVQLALDVLDDLITGGEWNEVGTDLYPASPGNSVIVDQGGSIGVGTDVAPWFGHSISQASGQFSSPGDAQYEQVVCYGETLAEGWVSLYPTASSVTGRLVLQTNYAYTVRVLVTGVQYGGTVGARFDTWSFELFGNIVVDSGDNLIMAPYTVNPIYSADPAVDARLYADDVNDSLEIQVYGVADRNIRWTAVVQLLGCIG